MKSEHSTELVVAFSLLPNESSWLLVASQLVSPCKDSERAPCRLLHHPRLYRHVHKRHHEWTAPIAITAVYCHPVEHALCNLAPPLLGVLLLGSHPATAWLWFSVALLSSLNAHSGFHLPFFPSPEAHDYHHLRFNQNFGVLGVLDRLHGTDRQFRQTDAYRRHLLLLSLAPLIGTPSGKQ